ncbi:MAG: NADH-quinone oxidoreductase subunit N [Gaiellales bacterium]
MQTPDLNWIALAPELATGGGALVALLVGMGRSSRSRMATIIVALVALSIATVFACMQFGTPHYSEFGGQLHSDALANVGRIIAALSGIVAVILGVRGRADDGRHGEFHALLLAAVCGMGLLAAASGFVTLFIGLELFSIALYVLCALDAERVASLEAGLKYLIIGGLSSAVLLYGSALVYGSTGALTFGAIGDAGSRGMMLYAGAAMVLGGLAFKISAAPMHWWTPDVYEGAGTPVTAFMSTATKAVGFLALARVLTIAFGPEADRWVPIIAALSVISMIVGNFGALVQSHLKRMLAYSSIAQAGYLLAGIVAWDTSGVPALVYALFVYTAMTLGAFVYVVVLEREIGREATYADLAGRGWLTDQERLTQALPGIGLTICALSLAGIPPTAGFFSKFGLFGAAVESGYAWLAVVGVLTSVVSLGYYLRIIIELYARTPDAVRIADEAATLPAPAVGVLQPVGIRMPVSATLGVALAAAVLLLAFVPQRVFDAGCDVRSGLLMGGSCTQVDARAGSGAVTASTSNS